MPPTHSTFSVIYRLYMIAMSRAVGNDLSRVEAWNERIYMRNMFEAFAGPKDNSKPFDAISRKMGPEAARFWVKLTRDTKDKVPVTVHRYSPSRHIHGFEFRQFYRDRVEPLLRSGYQDAREHDCEQSKCILPRHLKL